ncbi:MAG: tetratricopeptide repeat protein [Cyanobacteria bacterium SZAS LIN-3]|nr:tetratricopeptide repeat protein [Cyanobacteria bacterium SZAS LIN-3]
MSAKLRRFALPLLSGALLSSLSPCAQPALAQRTLLVPVSRAWENAYRAGNYREALKLCDQSMELAKNAKLKKGEMAMLLYNKGETLRSMGRYKEAEATLKESLKSCEENPSLRTNLIALPNIYNAMPMIYESEGRFAEAESMWQECTRMTHKNVNFAWLPANHLAHLYLTWGKLEKGREYVERAEAIARRAPKSLAVAYAHYNRAIYLQLKGQYKESEKEYDLALSSVARINGNTHPYYAVTLIEQSELFREESRYAEAEKCLNQALAIHQASYEAEHPETAAIKVRLARVLSEEGKYTEAKELVQQALKVEESVFGKEDNLFIARALDCQGNILRQDGRYQEAAEAISKALTMQKNLLGQNNIDAAITMRDLAMVDEDLANYKEAEALLKESLAIIKGQTGLEHPQRAAGANALAHFYLRDGRYDDAEPLFKESLALSEKVLGENHSVTASSARDLGELYTRQGKYDEAQTYLLKALHIDEKLYGEKAPQVAADLMSLISIYGAQGKTEDADPLLKRVAEIKNVLPGAGIATETAEPMSADSDRPVTDKWALVIGVSNFKDPTINLKYAAKDATDFRNFLINSEKFKPDHVKLLTDENADRENIIGMMGDKWLGRHVHKDDLVIVYVSSHGSRSQDSAGGVNFLVAHDTNKNSLLATGIPMQWLTNIVRDQVHSDRVILILDVCHSGSAAQGSKSLNRMPGMGLEEKYLKIGSGQMIICSSSADQVSWESKNYENSVFTRKLMEALQTSKDKTTLMEAYKRLKVLVETEVLRDRGDLQTPVLWNKTWHGKDPVLAVDVSGAPQGK